ncbi:MAG: hypothetical protein HQL45_13560 [Alphaproteobacteria bacterium]|nr:hypothetical protein [Alphaproteobacteria bacterium]
MTDQDIKAANFHVSWVWKPEWKIKSDYQFIHQIPGFALAWQFLQRLPEYRKWQKPLDEMTDLSWILPQEIRKELGLEKILPQRPTMRFREETVSDPLIPADSVQKDFTGFLNRMSKSDVLRHRENYIGIYKEVCVDTAKAALQDRWGVTAPWAPGSECGKIDEFNPFLPIAPPRGQPNRESIIVNLRILDARAESAHDMDIMQALFPHYSNRDRKEKLHKRDEVILKLSNKGYLVWLNSPPK